MGTAADVHNVYAVKPRLIVFFGGSGKELWIRENDTCGLYKVGFMQVPQKMNDVSGKTIVHERYCT